MGKLLEDLFPSMLAWAAEKRNGKRTVSAKRKGSLLLKKNG
ncbi:hypothetical protein ACIFQM_12930 [Paenibacillus sp. NRS-1782]